MKHHWQGKGEGHKEHHLQGEGVGMGLPLTGKGVIWWDMFYIVKVSLV